MAYKVNYLETDVLIVGGGVAGLCAALQADADGQRVTILEQSNTYRAGNSGSGVDHLCCYLPEVHGAKGYTVDQMTDDMMELGLGTFGLANRDIVKLFVEKSHDRVLGLEKYGIKIRGNGSKYVKGFRPIMEMGLVPTWLYFEGRDITVFLTEAVRKNTKAQILNHFAAVKILKDKNGNAAGAIALSTRDEAINVITAKTTILATTTGVGRLGNDFYMGPSIVNYGSGITLATNAGAEVINLEFSISGPKYMIGGFEFTCGCPGGSYWPAGQVIDDQGNVIVHRSREFSFNDPDYVEKYKEQSNRYEREKVSVVEKLSQGVPLYVDMSLATDEEIKYIKNSLYHEGLTWLLLNHLDDRKIDLRNVRIPLKLSLGTNIGGASTGVLTDVTLESTIHNLYAAGSTVGGGAVGGAAGAVVLGYEAGEQAAKRAASISDLPDTDAEQGVQEILSQIQAFRENTKGETWKAEELGVRDILETFGNYPLTDQKITDALELIRKAEKHPNIHATDEHEVVRSFEVLSLLQSAEAIFTAANLRKDDLAFFRRKRGKSEGFYGERAATSDGKIHKTDVYGIYRGSDGELKYNTHRF